MNGFEKETEPDDGLDVDWGIEYQYRGFFVKTCRVRKNGLYRAFAKSMYANEQDFQSDYLPTAEAVRAQIAKYIDKFADSL